MHKSIIFINKILLVKIKYFIFYIYFINISKHRGGAGGGGVLLKNFQYL